MPAPDPPKLVPYDRRQWRTASSRVWPRRRATPTPSPSKPASGWCSPPGAVPIDQSGSLVGAGDLRAQTRAVLTNLAEALHGAGTGLDRVVATTVYVVAAEQADLSTCGKR